MKIDKCSSNKNNKIQDSAYLIDNKNQIFNTTMEI